MDARPQRVGIIGRGAIGATLARLVPEHPELGCTVSGVVDRSSAPDELKALIADSDVIVEAAGHEALASYGPAVVEAGVDLLVVSAGALVDDDLLDALQPSADGGRLLVSSGAIGGLDLLRAAELLGPLAAVSLRSTKRPMVLLQPWMDPETTRRLEAGKEVLEVFSGSAREAARRFPASANVAATLGLATIGLDATTVAMVADPAAERVTHVVEASGPAGTYAVSIQNNPSPDNPRTSAITPYAVLRALHDLQANTVIGL